MNPTLKVFYGPAICGWKDYISRILEIALQSPIEETTIEEANVLVEELGDQMRYIYSKQWLYSFLFSTEPFHHEPKPYTAIFCGNNEMTATTKDKCVLFPFYWFETKLNKELEALKPWSGPIPQKFACAFVSNPLNEFRTKVILCLSQMGYLDSYGLIGNNTGGRYHGDPTLKMKEYKFNICFENARHEAYISEKLPNTLRAGIIPIYWGCPNIDKYFNINRFIWIKDETDNTICQMLSLILLISMNPEKWFNICNQPLFPDEGPKISLESMGSSLKCIIDGRPTSPR